MTRRLCERGVAAAPRAGCKAKPLSFVPRLDNTTDYGCRLGVLVLQGFRYYAIGLMVPYRARSRTGHPAERRSKVLRRGESVVHRNIGDRFLRMSQLALGRLNAAAEHVLGRRYSCSFPKATLEPGYGQTRH